MMFFELIFYGSYLVFVFLGLCLWLFMKKKWRVGMMFLMALSLVFIYGRFVEPQMVLVMDKRVLREGGVNIAVVSDVHLGVYKGEGFLERVVDKVNGLDVDLVLLPGDFVYEMEEGELDEAFEELGRLQVPAYGVLGNHDIVSSFGEFEEARISGVLEKYIELIDGEFVDLSVNGEELRLIGVRDFWSTSVEDVERVERQLSDERRNVLMTHNPDFAYVLKSFGLDEEIGLMVSGHTHGGQIRIPYLYKEKIPTRYDFDMDWHLVGSLKVFVSAGLGETALPIRFLVPPRIDVISI